MEKDPLPRWRSEFERFRYDVENAFLGEHVYAVIDGCVRGNPLIERGDPILSFIAIWYYQAITATIRRQIKDNPDSVSILRLLRQIKERPEVLGMSAADVESDTIRLGRATERVEEYVDRAVAHRDKRPITKRPRVGDVTDALKILRELYDKYGSALGFEPMRGAAEQLAPHWTNVLDVAWRRPANS